MGREYSDRPHLQMRKLNLSKMGRPVQSLTVRNWRSWDLCLAVGWGGLVCHTGQVPLLSQISPQAPVPESQLPQEVCPVGPREPQTQHPQT